MSNERKAEAGFAGAPGSAIRLRDGRTARVESVSQYGMLWIRDANGNLSSADPKTGWAGDGNWANDISPNEKLTQDARP